jgi:hypothetical protein
MRVAEVIFAGSVAAPICARNARIGPDIPMPKRWPKKRPSSPCHNL